MRVLFVCILLFATATTASADTGKAKLAEKAVTAWKCTAFAGGANMPEEMERLFKLGYSLLKEFVEARNNGEITEEEYKSNVPFIVMGEIRGPHPSFDFFAGTVFKASEQWAGNEILHGEDKFGSLKNNKYVRDKLWGMSARDLFREGNCASID